MIESQSQSQSQSAQSPSAPNAAAAAIREAIERYARYSFGDTFKALAPHDRFRAVALAVREFALDRMAATEERYKQAGAKRVYYLSMEFLIGRSLTNNLLNLGLYDEFDAALEGLGSDVEEVQLAEQDAALGNGGLGRLAACFLDSLATLDMPGYGYGINYDYGLFRQEIDNGYQRERPDAWQRRWTPWQLERAEEACIVPVYGRIEHGRDRDGAYNPMWLDWKVLIGVPNDMPVVGYGGKTVNYLRLYSARSSDDFDMQIFSQGDYIRAVEQKIRSETISKVLYPPDTVDAGKELRLLQEYFFVYCALNDITRRFLAEHRRLDIFADKVAIQLNDTHPALAVAELMRRLVDQYDVPWGRAWEITQATLAYTNHTLLPEALEKWPVNLLEYVIPRHMQIIYELNQRFLDRVTDLYPDDAELKRRVSLVEEGDEKQARMAHLAIIGSHSVNGVAALHSELVKKDLVPHFHRIWPERFNNKTNGVTQRRWLLRANPELAALATEKIGDQWITDLDHLRGLEPLAGDSGFQYDFMRIKRANKEKLAALIAELVRVKVDPDSLFDIQIKRIHEYKRQLLNIMHVIHHYLQVVEDGVVPTVPRTYIFAGKAAPGYWAAKQIIKLINNVAQVINRDHRAREAIKVVFVPDYRVSLAERIIPAADLSEQVSTAGTEASGTGNMKFALNGALTIGTLDGANIEIKEEVGDDNIFIFGNTAAEIAKLREEGAYKPREFYQRDERLRRVVDAFVSDRFSAKEEGIFKWLHHSLLENDHYFHLADFDSYLATQGVAAEVFADRSAWAEKAILNVARIGKFSSDRTIREYAADIWGIKSIR